jgi:8-oxo-dGTP pyrophosphatase MutT (NUDIX family)
MYKVFINEKPVIITTTLDEQHVEPGNHIYQFTDIKELKREIERFIIDRQIQKLTIINSVNIEMLFQAFASLFVLVEAAGGVVYHPRKGMLWIKRHGRWDLPKGKADDNESITAAALREVEEETGLGGLSVDADLGTTLHAYEEKNNFLLKTSHWFLMRTTEPDTPLVPQTNEGITEAVWATEEDVLEKINDTYASLKETALNFVEKYTRWNIPFGQLPK